MVVQPKPRPGRRAGIWKEPEQRQVPSDTQIVRPDEAVRRGQQLQNALAGFFSQHRRTTTQVTQIPQHYQAHRHPIERRFEGFYPSRIRHFAEEQDHFIDPAKTGQQ